MASRSPKAPIEVETADPYSSSSVPVVQHQSSADLQDRSDSDDIPSLLTETDENEYTRVTFDSDSGSSPNEENEVLIELTNDPLNESLQIHNRTFGRIRRKIRSVCTSSMSSTAASSSESGVSSVYRDDYEFKSTTSDDPAIDHSDSQVVSPNSSTISKATFPLSPLKLRLPLFILFYLFVTVCQ